LKDTAVSVITQKNYVCAPAVLKRAFEEEMFIAFANVSDV